MFKSTFNVLNKFLITLSYHILKHLPYFLFQSPSAFILNFKTLAFFLLKTYETQSLTLKNNQGTPKIPCIAELALIFIIWSFYLLLTQFGLLIVRIRCFYQAGHLQIHRLLADGAITLCTLKVAVLIKVPRFLRLET